MLQAFKKEDRGRLYWHRLLKKPMILIQIEAEMRSDKKWYQRRKFLGQGQFRLLDGKAMHHAWLYPWEFEEYVNQRENDSLGFGGGG